MIAYFDQYSSLYLDDLTGRRENDVGNFEYYQRDSQRPDGLIVSAVAPVIPDISSLRSEFISPQSSIPDRAIYFRNSLVAHFGELLRLCYFREDLPSLQIMLDLLISLHEGMLRENIPLVFMIESRMRAIEQMEVRFQSWPPFLQSFRYEMQELIDQDMTVDTRGQAMSSWIEHREYYQSPDIHRSLWSLGELILRNGSEDEIQIEVSRIYTLLEAFEKNPRNSQGRIIRQDVDQIIYEVQRIFAWYATLPDFSPDTCINLSFTPLSEL